MTYRSERALNNQVYSTQAGESHASPKRWKWLKQSLYQGCLVSAICILAGRSFFLWPSHPVIALGCGVAACTVVLLNRKQILQIHRDFKGLNGFTKVLAAATPIIIGITLPALVGYSLNISLNECFIAIPLNSFSAGLPFFKAKDGDIDRFFLSRSRGYKGKDFDAISLSMLAGQALSKLQQPRQRNASNNPGSDAVPSGSVIIEEIN
ncbi:MAG: hypothetical protein C5B45_05150 [Chlamydiae bacterium]|nr:MAG: hypothetical protein C5B45_05150 [Chlamydiota bacterium]